MLQDQGRKGLLVTQHIHPDQAPDLEPYWEMERALAERYSALYLLDARALLQPYVTEGLLIDRNHLSRTGNFRLAQILHPEMLRILSLDTQ